MKRIASGVLEVVGLTVAAAGLWLLAPWLGLLAAGVVLVTCGLAIDPPARGGE